MDTTPAADGLPVFAKGQVLGLSARGVSTASFVVVSTVVRWQFGEVVWEHVRLHQLLPALLGTCRIYRVNIYLQHHRMYLNELTLRGLLRYNNFLNDIEIDCLFYHVAYYGS